MMNTSRTGHNKASILIDDLSNGIKLNPETFHKFVAALKEDGPWTENIVSHVLEAHSNIKASGTVGQPTILYFYTFPVNFHSFYTIQCSSTSITKDPTEL